MLEHNVMRQHYPVHFTACNQVLRHRAPLPPAARDRGAPACCPGTVVILELSLAAAILPARMIHVLHYPSIHTILLNLGILLETILSFFSYHSPRAIRTYTGTHTGQNCAFLSFIILQYPSMLKPVFVFGINLS